ncbi:hypothetical protein CBR_g50909 [Chara braunii]|uniref:Protein kinase domain-containing protein n=1 Tax=Chara braunii TaxID=69332 RepID=A0A388M7Q5_CHABU|nr:hypothetical protein CBR_g50909 [Chara braunii]|eukprot:GBG90566.1 hypothetical protein CBR_g50909 [Chara braunii]
MPPTPCPPLGVSRDVLPLLATVDASRRHDSRALVSQWLARALRGENKIFGGERRRTFERCRVVHDDKYNLLRVDVLVLDRRSSGAIDDDSAEAPLVEREDRGNHAMAARLRLLRHPHILTLLGVCYEESYLVYENMARGTVKDWISCARQSTWYARFRVMAEVARALCFLHSDPLGTGGPIIHSAIRPTTIFLDDKFVAKLGGVDRALLDSEPREGVEKTLRTSQLFTQQNSHYVAPESWQFRVFSEKTDVFAFGITLLEMLTGNFTNAFEVVEDAIEDDNAFENALDPNAGCWDIDLARRVARLGLCCTSYNRRKRPDMAAPHTGILAILEEVAGKVELAVSTGNE